MINLIPENNSVSRSIEMWDTIKKGVKKGYNKWDNYFSGTEPEVENESFAKQNRNYRNNNKNAGPSLFSEKRVIRLQPMFTWMSPPNENAGGIQGLFWFAKNMRIDNDNDLAQEHFEADTAGVLRMIYPPLIDDKTENNIEYLQNIIQSFLKLSSKSLADYKYSDEGSEEEKSS